MVYSSDASVICPCVSSPAGTLHHDSERSIVGARRARLQLEGERDADERALHEALEEARQRLLRRN